MEKDSKPRRLSDTDEISDFPDGYDVPKLRDIVPRQEIPKKFMVPRRLK